MSCPVCGYNNFECFLKRKGVPIFQNLLFTEDAESLDLRRGYLVNRWRDSLAELAKIGSWFFGGREPKGERWQIWLISKEPYYYYVIN